MATLETVAIVLKTLVVSKPGARLGENTLEVYASLLAPIPDAALMDAGLIHARSESDFLPSAGTLYQTALGLMDTQPNAGEAWALVLKYLRGSTVDLPARAVKVLTEMGGKAALQDGHSEPIYRAQFTKLYEQATQKERRAATISLPKAQTLCF